MGMMIARSTVSAAFALTLLTAASAEAACLRDKTHPCVNFDIVPAVTDQIVREEKASEGPRRQSAAGTAATPYTGPTVGVSTMARAPTVGYHWSLQ